MKYLSTLILALCSLVLYTQDAGEIYNIIQIRGGIFNISAGSNLEQGNILKPKDKLEFENNAFATVISNAKRKYSLKMPYFTGSEDVFAYAELSLSPVHSRGQLSTRGAIGESGVKDLKNYLGNETFNIIGDKHEILLDKDLYKLNNDEFIVFYYTINENQVSKKVGFNKQVLNIEKEKLIASKGDTLYSDTIKLVSVYKYQQSTGNNELITKINLSFVNELELKKEFFTIILILRKQNMTDDEISDYLKEYFYDIYGQVDDDQLNKLIETALN